MIKVYRKRLFNIQGIIVLCFLVVIAFEGIIYVHNRFTKRSLAGYTNEVMAHCKTAGFAPSCYDQEIPKLMDRISMEQAFEVTRLVQQKDPRYLYCHVLGHNLSYQEAEKHPDAWKDIITRCPSTMCNNGCLHGALMRRFNQESLTDAQIEEVKPDLMDVCEPRGNWKPTEVERSMCYHSFGHLAMYMTAANITASTDLCRTLGTKADGRNYVQTCTEGVLMTIFQPLEPEDIALVQSIAPKTKDDAISFCSQFTGMIWEACRRESWPLFSDVIRSPGGVVQFCSFVSDEIGQRICQHAAMNSLTIALVVEKGNTIDALDEYCRALSGIARDWCYGHAAQRLMQIDPTYEETAIGICHAAQVGGVGEYCWNGLLYYATYSFPADSAQFHTYCQKLPAPWSERCLSGEKPEGFW